WPASRSRTKDRTVNFPGFSTVRAPPGSPLPLPTCSAADASTAVIEEEQMTFIETSVQFPALRRPDPKTADPGTVRLGDAAITAAFPPLHRPDPKTADPGTVRLGDAAITAVFPTLRRLDPKTADPGTV